MGLPTMAPRHHSDTWTTQHVLAFEPRTPNAKARGMRIACMGIYIFINFYSHKPESAQTHYIETGKCVLNWFIRPITYNSEP